MPPKSADEWRAAFAKALTLAPPVTTPASAGASSSGTAPAGAGASSSGTGAAPAGAGLGQTPDALSVSLVRPWLAL